MLTIGALALIGVCIALWFTADAADERAKSDREKLVDSGREMRSCELKRPREPVADALREERDKDRAAARQTVQGINNAPIDQVVPSVLPLAYCRAAQVGQPVGPRFRPTQRPS